MSRFENGEADLTTGAACSTTRALCAGVGAGAGADASATADAGAASATVAVSVTVGAGAGVGAVAAAAITASLCARFRSFFSCFRLFFSFASADCSDDCASAGGCATGRGLGDAEGVVADEEVAGGVASAEDGAIAVGALRGSVNGLR